MNEQQGVIFIRRKGDTAKGAQWHNFMQAQRDALDTYRLHGWKLVAAVGVHEAQALAGVLLYFSKDG
jgi:hypothetical protein